MAKMIKIAWRGLAMGLGALALQANLGGIPALAHSHQIPVTTHTAGDARALVRATIVRPLSLANTSEMNFGTVLADGSGGSMSLSPSGDFSTLGVTVSDNTRVKPGKFTLLGTHGQAYSISFARTANIESPGAISVVTFTHDAGGTPTLDNDGKGLFNIGATLKIGARQSAGSYYGSVDVIISNF